MKTLLALAVMFAVLWHGLCWSFDVTQAAHRAGAAAQENRVNEVIDAFGPATR